MASRSRSRREKDVIPVSGAPPRDGSALCLSCGLCCDGTLFSRVELAPAEREYVESLGLEIVEEGGRIGSPQPCPAFDSGCCALYAVGRPATCGTYKCRVLSAYLDGTRTYDEALAILLLVRSLARDVEVAMGLPPAGYNRVVAQGYIAAHDPAARPREHVDFLIAFYRLTYLGQKYFGYPLQPAEVTTAQAGREVSESRARAH